MNKLLLPLLLAGLLGGCPEAEGNLLTYFGPDVTESGEIRFPPGERLAVTGLVTRAVTESEMGLVEVVLVESPTPVTCSMYTSWLAEVAALQDYAREMFALAPEDRPEEWQDYVCQELGGAARDVFGGEGTYRALHLLMNVSGLALDFELFRPASQGDADDSHLGANLIESQAGHYAGRMYERSKHAEGLLPSDADLSYERFDFHPVHQCAAFADKLAEEAEEVLDEGAEKAYPDHDAFALQTATHRWYHYNDGRTDVALDGGGSLPVGLTFADWRTAGTEGGALSVTAFLEVSRVRDDFPFEHVLLTTKGAQLQVDECTRLNDFLPVVWPEVEALDAPPLVGGDDDASAR